MVALTFASSMCTSNYIILSKASAVQVCLVLSTCLTSHWKLIRWLTFALPPCPLKLETKCKCVGFLNRIQVPGWWGWVSAVLWFGAALYQTHLTAKCLQLCWSVSLSAFERREKQEKKMQSHINSSQIEELSAGKIVLWTYPWFFALCCINMCWMF